MAALTMCLITSMRLTLAFTPEPAMRFQGILYRALNPLYASDPLSGRGAALYGGRFNRKGIPALYTSLSIVTAIREANQVGTLQPTTLVSYRADIERVFDCRDVLALKNQGMESAMLADPAWRNQMKTSGEAMTQAFAHRLGNAGYHGLLVNSFAKGVGKDEFNIVLWQWSDTTPCKLTLVDDENRLSGNFLSQ